MNKPEALIFADDRPTNTSDDLYQWAVDAEDLIRAQHERITELESKLVAVPQAAQADTPTDDELRMMWVAAGGDFFDPKTVTCSMPESKLLPLLRRFATHSTQQALDSKLLSLDSDLLTEARRALWNLSPGYADDELRLRAHEHLERIDDRRCVGRENIFNSHAALAVQAKQGEK